MAYEHKERRSGHDIEGIVRTAVEQLKKEIPLLSREEHDFIAMLIRREQIRFDRWEKIKTQVLGWGIIAIAGWIGVIVWDNVIRMSRGIH